MKNILKGAFFTLLFVNMSCYSQLTNYFKNDGYNKFGILERGKSQVVMVAEMTAYYKDPTHYFDILKVSTSADTKTQVLEGHIAKYKEKQGDYVGSATVNGRFFIAMKYVFDNFSSELVLYEFNQKAGLKSKKVVFDQGKGSDLNDVEFSLSSDKESLVFCRRYNNQLYYRVLNFDDNVLKEEKNVFIPYLTGGYNFKSIDGELMYLMHFVGNDLVVHTLKAGWIEKTDKVEANVFESINYNYVVDGQDLYITTGLSYLNFSYLIAVSAHKITPDQKIVSSEHEFTTSDYDDAQLSGDNRRYIDHYETDVDRKLVHTSDNLVLTWGLGSGYGDSQFVSFWFDKATMKFTEQQIIPRKIYSRKVSSKISTYVLNDEVRGFYYDYPTNVSIKKYADRKSVKSLKSASLMSFTQKVTNVVMKDEGKQKILPNDKYVYPYDDYVAVLCFKGSKRYWKFINK